MRQQSFRTVWYGEIGEHGEIVTVRYTRLTSILTFSYGILHYILLLLAQAGDVAAIHPASVGRHKL